MKLQQEVARSNHEIQNIVPVLELSLKRSQESDLIILSLFDVVDGCQTSEIPADNIVILGSNEELNQKISSFFQFKLAQAGKVAKLIEASKFLSLIRNNKENKDIFYIITTDDSIFLENLTVLKNHSSTQIVSRTEGVEWNLDGIGLSISENAEIILNR